ncbi:PASTA domain-containing protein [Nocardioides sp. MAH-18]|uniref:PASTA domain-containing protein n=1 Tax=Nocardioides agri TaxID=2682843 RepID=A0A6L6XSN1_9ACTN|nr:PASTA domain-containing protein [Nocardioides sp. CGMCC 1.13656]MBA2954772.1 PASTA domain-containing protein [Nocardioides sp. CGMCC 1.13656]MVQ49627.1 PASTA domain-containing protein [Nocardioides sp. MAH-18]
MDPRDYRDARWHALLREAEELGVPAEDAPAVVARVLGEQQRRIRRADDPDPLVREALADAVLGPPERTGRRRWPAALILAAGLLVLGVVVLLTRPQPPPADHLGDDQLPSLFGFDRTTAEQVLEDRGFEVQLRTFQSCEVRDRVVASDPGPGARVDRGDEVIVYTSLPTSNNCLPRYAYREAAWRFLDFANGRGPAPEFADRVFVYPEDGRRLVLTGAETADPEAWAATGVFSRVRAASDDVALVSERPLAYAVPAIRVVDATEDLGTCGVPATAVAGTSDAIAVLVRPADRQGCSLRIELYRDAERRIESVAVYPAVD